MRKNEQLEVQYANDKEAKDYINREVERIESEAYKKAQKEKTEAAIKKYRFSWSEREKEIRERERRIRLSEL